MDTPASSTEQEEGYMTVWSAPPKKPAGWTKFRETRHPVFRGVRRRGNAGRWVSEVRVPGRRGCRLWLGTFATPEAAARAHDAAMLAIAGAGACLNFADSAWLLPQLMPAPASMSGARELRGAVAGAVEALMRRRSARTSDDEGSCGSSTTAPVDTADVEGASPAAPWSGAVFEFQFDDGFRFGGMDDVEAYYASLAQGLLVDPPTNAPSWEDGESSGAEMVLWSY